MAKDTEPSKLAAFLLALQTSPSAQKRFKKNMRAEMERFDLSTETIEAVLGSKREALWKILTRGPVHVGAVISHVAAATGVPKPHRRRKK